MLLSIIILTRDEQANLPTCLESIQSIEAQVYIVDSGSEDRTVEIAREKGCQIFVHPWESYAQQLNWALENLPISTPWTMRLDADERLTSD